MDKPPDLSAPLVLTPPSPKSYLDLTLSSSHSASSRKNLATSVNSPEGVAATDLAIGSPAGVRASRRARPSSNDTIRSMCDRSAANREGVPSLWSAWARAQCMDHAPSRSATRESKTRCASGGAAPRGVSHGTGVPRRRESPGKFGPPRRPGWLPSRPCRSAWMPSEIGSRLRSGRTARRRRTRGAGSYRWAQRRRGLPARGCRSRIGRSRASASAPCVTGAWPGAGPVPRFGPLPMQCEWGGYEPLPIAIPCQRRPGPASRGPTTPRGARQGGCRRSHHRYGAPPAR